MGERKNRYFRVRFNRKLRVGFKGAQVTSDGGLVAIDVTTKEVLI